MDQTKVYVGVNKFKEGTMISVPGTTEESALMKLRFQMSFTDKKWRKS
jgi:hypothetical protein